MPKASYDTLEFLTTLTAKRFRLAAQEMQSSDPDLAKDIRDQADELERANRQRITTESILQFHQVRS